MYIYSICSSIWSPPITDEPFELRVPADLSVYTEGVLNPIQWSGTFSDRRLPTPPGQSRFFNNVQYISTSQPTYLNYFAGAVGGSLPIG